MKGQVQGVQDRWFDGLSMFNVCHMFFVVKLCGSTLSSFYLAFCGVREREKEREQLWSAELKV